MPIPTSAIWQDGWLAATGALHALLLSLKVWLKDRHSSSPVVWRPRMILYLKALLALGCVCWVACEACSISTAGVP